MPGALPSTAQLSYVPSTLTAPFSARAAARRFWRSHASRYGTRPSQWTPTGAEGSGARSVGSADGVAIVLRFLHERGILA